MSRALNSGAMPAQDAEPTPSVGASQRLAPTSSLKKLAPASSAPLSNEWHGLPLWSYAASDPTTAGAAPRDHHVTLSSHCRADGCQ